MLPNFEETRISYIYRSTNTQNEAHFAGFYPHSALHPNATLPRVVFKTGRSRFYHPGTPLAPPLLYTPRRPTFVDRRPRAETLAAVSAPKMAKIKSESCQPNNFSQKIPNRIHNKNKPIEGGEGTRNPGKIHEHLDWC